MNPRLKQPTQRNPKLTKEQKLQKIKELETLIEQLKSQRKASTNEEERKELQRQIISRQTQRNKIKRSIEYFYPEDTVTVRRKIKNSRKEDFQQFKKEKLQQIELYKKLGFNQKVKVMEEQLYYAELRYKYQYSVV